MKFNPDAFGIIVTAILQGPSSKRKIEMLVDTGATMNIIPFEIAKILGYRPWETKDFVDITTATGVESMPVINLDKIKVLEKGVDNVKTLCHDLPPTSRVDGLLGLSFLKSFNIFIDFKRGVFELK